MIKQIISKDSQIILVIDRVDKFVDPSSSKESNIAFWLPRALPDKVKLILTCTKESESYNYFVKNNAKFLETCENIEITNFMIKGNEDSESFVDSEVRNKVMDCFKNYPEEIKKNSKFTHLFLNCFLPYPNNLVPQLSRRDKLELNQILKTMDYTKLSRVNSYDELMEIILVTYESKITMLEKFQKLLIALAISYKGLTVQEIMHLVLFFTITI